MSRRIGVVIAIVMFAMLLPTSIASASGQDPGTLYFTNEGFPESSMTPIPPQKGELSNFDPGRDLAPGLILERTALGLLEADGARFQQWQSDSRGQVLSTVPNLFLWVATEDFDDSKTGVITAYLLECAVWGEDCKAFAAKHHSFRAEPGESWVEAKISFGSVDYEIPEGRVLAVRVVAAMDSETDVLFAYDRLEYRSRLAFASRSLVPVEELVPEALLASVADSSTTPVVTEPPTPAPDTQIEPGAPVESEGLSWLVTLGLSVAVMLVLGLVLLGTLGSGGQHRTSRGVHAWLDRVEGYLNRGSEIKRLHQ
jgi:hypothetical protein